MKVALQLATPVCRRSAAVVVAIDLTDSTHAAGFSSTLLNRTLDIDFVLRTSRRASTGRHSFLPAVVDAERAAVIGYSKGGCGTLDPGGAG